MIEIGHFACSNWVIAPVALAVNEGPPADIRDQRFMLILTGVGVFDLAGTHDHNWQHHTAHMRPGVDAPLAHAVGRYQIPPPPGIAGNQYTREFQVEQIAPFTGLASLSNFAAEENMGWACDAWRPSPYETRTDAFTSAPLPNLFAGVEADLAIRAYLVRMQRLNYQITMIGKIVFAAVIIT